MVARELAGDRDSTAGAEAAAGIMSQPCEPVVHCFGQERYGCSVVRLGLSPYSLGPEVQYQAR